MIKLTNLNKYFNRGKKNEIHVINNATLELPDHGIVTFFGHSGSGKTTLLNAIGGLDSFKGEIQYDDTIIKNYRMGKIDAWRSKNVGYVFQNYDLLQNESVYDNLAIALSIIGINDKDEAKIRIEYALKAVGLFKFRKRKAYALSGGQQQRVAIARALVKKCKVLIADEPTGNLDSANTIEVMNVLKSISKNTLVLLVTHEKDIADFYSDQIIEVADGKIINIKVNNTKDASLQDRSNNAIYLGDMEKVEQEGETLDFTVYKEPGDESKKHLDIFIKNNTVYVRGDATIRLVNESSLNIIDGKRKVITQEDTDVLTYDNSFYDDTKKGHGGFARFTRTFLTSWHSLFSAKKKTKFLYACLVLMGIVFAIASASYVNNTMTDDSSFAYCDGYYETLNSNVYHEEPILDAWDKGYISNVEIQYGGNYIFQQDITFAEYVSCYVNAMKVPYSEKVNIKYGRGVKNDNEIVISENIAEDILDNFTYKTTVESLLGKTLSSAYEYSNSGYTLVGISADDHNMSYVTSKDIALSNVNFSSKKTTHLISAIENGHYDVVEGRDVDNSSSEKECLIANTMLEGATYYCDGIDGLIEIPTNLKFDGTEKFGDYTLVGKFEFKDGISLADNAIITNEAKGSYTYIPNDYVNKGASFSTAYSYIVEGREPKLSNEVAVYAYSGYKIGDKLSDYDVVGLYSGGFYAASYLAMFNKNVVYIRNDITYCLYEFSNVKESTEYLRDKHQITVDTMYKIQLKEKMDKEASSRGVFYAVFAISFIAAGIFIFFIMRSRMLTDIYTIGVYRSLGAKRWSIVSKYMLESSILTLMFTIIGYIGGCLAYYGVATLINGVVGNVMMVNVPIFVLIGAIILVLSTLVGTLPIITLFLRTPAQIKTKYDI